MISVSVCNFVLIDWDIIMYTYSNFGKVSSHDTIQVQYELLYWMVSMVKMWKGKELLLIYFKTLK